VLTAKTSDFGSGARNEHMRSVVRVNSRVPVVVEWSAEDGRTCSVEGVTMDVSVKGCMVVAAQELAIGQKLKLVNKITDMASEAVLIWRGHQGRTGWELGLELQNPPYEFWGVEF